MVGNSSKVKNKLVRSKKEKVSFVTFYAYTQSI